jgi:hypothetical protein
MTLNAGVVDVTLTSSQVPVLGGSNTIKVVFV